MNENGVVESFAALAADENVRQNIEILFNSNFEFSNEQHRINLGLALARIQNGLE